MNIQLFAETYGTPLELPANSHVFIQGDPDRSLYFLKSGLLKAYYISATGKESVKSFILPGDFIGSLTAAYSKESCSFNLLCLRDSYLIQVPFDTLYHYSAQNQVIANKVIELLLNFSMKKERREYELLSLSAEERYRLLIERSPSLIEMVTQNDIARYLGITPVALSRIKKRLKTP